VECSQGTCRWVDSIKKLTKIQNLLANYVLLYHYNHYWIKESKNYEELKAEYDNLKYISKILFDKQGNILEISNVAKDNLINIKTEAKLLGYPLQTVKLFESIHGHMKKITADK